MPEAEAKLQPGDWYLLNFFHRVKRYQRETILERHESGEPKRIATMLDPDAVAARLEIEGVPQELWRLHFDTAEFLFALDRGDVDPAAYPLGLLDGDC